MTLEEIKLSMKWLNLGERRLPSSDETAKRGQEECIPTKREER